MRRRAFMVGGAVATAAALGGGVAGVASDIVPESAAFRRRLGWTGPDGVVPDVPEGRITRRRVTSRATRSRPELVTIDPHGVPAEQADRLPVCLMLHGRGSSAYGLVELGMARFLTQAVRDGVPPCRLVAVDGGEASYWQASGGSDPQRMLLRELPGWLGGSAPRAVLGISMGGFGALRYARSRAVDAVALLSPALFRTWTDARAVGVFQGQTDWTADEPLLHTAQLRVQPAGIGLWCGREDPFHDAALEFADAVHPAVAAFDHGAHDEGYWRRVAPDALRFVGERLLAKNA
ncbi:alpha/beta hydrolase [Streptomyces sp. NPDC088354]|uniref:alpha/beta hydrolase n=1 Tax=Streptomyces sp. NPDC088354 TaxID=3365856 RepID=UPI0037F79834